MKVSTGRAYTMQARAKATEETGDRILDAAFALFTDYPFEDVSLDAVAERADVATRTVIRRFRSKEDLFVTAMNRARDEMIAHRNAAPVGDISGIVHNVIGQYERWGDNRLRMIAQEEKIDIVGANARGGRQFHRDWVARVFAPMLKGFRGPARKRRINGLIVLTDVFTWKLLRRDHGLSRKETEQTLIELIQAFEREGT
jgi:AcrR family transcriptional regulator